jgi:hypothetical protein
VRNPRPPLFPEVGKRDFSRKNLRSQVEEKAGDGRRAGSFPPPEKEIAFLQPLIEEKRR